MEKHPLSYFIDLISGQGIAKMRNDFYHGTPTETVISVDMQSESIQYMDDNDLVNPIFGVYYFSSTLNETLSLKRAELFTNLDLYFINNQDATRKGELIRILKLGIVDLIMKCDSYADAAKYPFIKEILEDIQLKIDQNYITDSVDAIKNSRQTVMNISKLHWQGNLNILTTLFYDLINGNKAKDIPALIKATPKEIENFIINNFVDSTGEPFSPSTVNTNLKPSKQSQKRAKGEISIEIVKN